MMSVEGGKAAKLLLEHGACVNATVDKDGTTPLLFALTYKGSSDKQVTEKVSLLLKHGAHVNAANKHGQTPLHKAAKSHHIKAVHLLLDHGACVNAADVKGKTPLMAAVQFGNIKRVKLLLEHGACVNVKDSEGETALIRAIQQDGGIEKVRLLLKHGANLNTIDDEGRTPLMAAIWEPLEMVEMFIDHGANLDAVDKEGKTVLSRAAELGDLRALKYILERETNTANIPDNDGYTPIMRAIMEFDKDEVTPAVGILIKYGGNVNAVAKDGNTAMSLAADRGYNACMDVLLENGYDLNGGYTHELF